jgi:CheY-like chemotaxis protein
MQAHTDVTSVLPEAPERPALDLPWSTGAAGAAQGMLAGSAGSLPASSSSPSRKRNLKVLTDTLSSVGFDVAVATNGTRAIQLAAQLASKGRGAPDLILLDVRMEGIDGYETCRRLKADEATRDIPVIFMTASSENAANRVALDIDFNGMVTMGTLKSGIDYALRRGMGVSRA